MPVDSLNIIMNKKGTLKLPKNLNLFLVFDFIIVGAMRDARKLFRLFKTVN